MRTLLLIFCSCALWVPAARGQTVFESPAVSPDGELTALCSRSVDPATRGVSTSLIITERDGTVVYRDEDTLWGRAAESLRWTPDGKFLVLATRDGDGHHAWRHYVYAYSTAAKSIRSLDAAFKLPIISAEIWCQAPDVVIMVGQDVNRGTAELDDPALVRLALAGVWSHLQ